MLAVSRGTYLTAFRIKYNKSISVKVKEKKIIKTQFHGAKNGLEFIIFIHHPPRYVMAAQIPLQIFRASASSEKCRKRCIG
jgi:hypothetical protein